MRLFLTAFWIALKHSSRRLLCLLCVLGVCAGLGLAAFSALPVDARPKAVVAVVNLDDDPLSGLALQSLAQMKSLSGLLEVRFAAPGEAVGDCAAVVTIPAGFLASVMSGENKPPLAEVNVTTPLEAVLVRQLARAGAQYLTAAQLGIYTVQEGTNYGETLTQRQYGLLLADVNITFLRAFIDRLSLVNAEPLSASGALTLPQYYCAALGSVLFFCYGFLYQPSVEYLRRFARRLPRGSARPLFPAACAHLLTLGAACVLPVFLLCGGLFGFTARRFSAALLFVLLAGSFALLLSLLLRGGAPCAAGCILLSAGMGLCGGGFLPLALMPPAFARAAPFLPVYQGQRLLGALMGGTADALWQPAAMAAVLLTAAALLWRFDRKGGAA